MIKINGKYIRNIPEQVGKNKRDIFELDTDLSALEVKVNEALAGVFHYKGSVATYGDLPSSNNEVGDVYNVLDTGKNYAWDGSAWDDLGGLVDLSNYVTLDTEQTITGEKAFTAKNRFSTIKATEGQNFTIYRPDGTTPALSIGTNDGITKSNYSIYPESNNTKNLGGSSLAWKDLYLAGNINIGGSYISANVNGGVEMGYNNQAYLVMYTYGIYVNSGITPLANNTHDLGTSSLAWKDIYLTSFVKVNSNSKDLAIGLNDSGTFRLEYDNGWLVEAANIYNMSINCNLVPNGNRNLGSSSLKWDNIYLANNLTNGTDSVTVADLAALITYAKAQGWIS